MKEDTRSVGEKLIPYILIYLFIFYATMVYIFVKYDTGGSITGVAPYADKPMLEVLQAAAVHMGEIGAFLGGFRYLGQGGMSLLSITFVYALAVLYFFTNAEFKAHAPAKTAKGSAHWYRNLNKFLKEHADFQPKKYKFKNKYLRSIEDIINPPKVSNNNMILGKNVMIANREGKNQNYILFGNAGSGKSFGFVKPNIMQMNGSYIVTDPAGELLSATAKPLLEAGYKVKVFSTSDMEHSQCYNPFDYVYDEDGLVDETRVSVMVNTFLKNANGMEEAKKGGDPFWEKSAKALLTACAMYLLEFAVLKDRNMYNMLKLVQMGKVDEDSSSSGTKLDALFEKARRERPDAHCFTSYDTFKLAPAKTANSILISAAVDLNMFSQDAVRNMTTTAYYVKKRDKVTGQIIEYETDRKTGELIYNDDENIDLRKIGSEKTALFINIPQANSTYNFLVLLLYSQTFTALYGIGEKLVNKTLMIRDKKTKEPLRTMITGRDPEERKMKAERLLELYKNAECVEEIDKITKEKKYFIKNDEAKKKDSIYKGAGYLEEVYSMEVGQKKLEKFKRGEVFRGTGSNNPSSVRLPFHVTMLLDEFANIGKIPSFPEIIATSRKYEISCAIILQSIAQIKDMYKDVYTSLIANCRASVFLGTPDMDTCEYFSKTLGNNTIKIQNTSLSTGSKGGNSSKSYNLDSRELMKPDELAHLDPKECIVCVSGEYPIRTKKFTLKDHALWEKTGDFDEANAMKVSSFADCSNKIFKSVPYAQDNAEIPNDTMPDGKPAAKIGKITEAPELNDMMGLGMNENPVDHMEEPAENDKSPMQKGRGGKKKRPGNKNGVSGIKPPKNKFANESDQSSAEDYNVVADDDGMITIDMDASVAMPF